MDICLLHLLVEKLFYILPIENFSVLLSISMSESYRCQICDLLTFHTKKDEFLCFTQKPRCRYCHVIYDQFALYHSIYMSEDKLKVHVQKTKNKFYPFAINEHPRSLLFRGS